MSLKHFGAEVAGNSYDIPLECIAGTYNVRSVFPNMKIEGVAEDKIFVELLKMATGTPEQKAEFVRLVTEHELARLESEPKYTQTINDLADNMALVGGQTHAGLFRQTGTVNRKDDDGVMKDADGTTLKKYTYMIIAGGRRTAAILLLIAEGRRTDHSVMARLIKCTNEEAFFLSVYENTQRSQFSDLEYGRIADRMRKLELTWADIAKRLGLSVPTCVANHALAFPNAEAPADLIPQLETGKITNQGGSGCRCQGSEQA